MSKLLTLSVIDDTESIHAEDVEVSAPNGLLGPDFEDTVITNSGCVIYVAENVEQVSVNR